MAKLSPNAPCPCGSGKKYKKCCLVYHKGALAPDALALMKSRYSAYAADVPDYIIKTTHPDNPDFTDDTKKWREEIKRFTQQTEFLKLKILDFMQEQEEAYVTFIATLSSGELREKSRFLKVSGRWLYVDGEFDQAIQATL
jgi:SEC-C motif-containing protein